MDIVKRGRGVPVTKMGHVAAAIAGLGVVAVGNAVLARRAERRNPPKGSFIEVDGVRLHYIEKGAGSPVVLIHGNQTMGEDFEISGVFDLIAQKHRVFAFDRPGFGNSARPRRKTWTAEAQAALIHKALQKIGVERPVMVGHSWGALMALTYALNYQADTSAVLLISGYYFPTFRLDVVMASWAAIPILGDILCYTVSPLIGWLTGPLIVKGSFAPAKVAKRFKKEFPFSMALRPSQIRATAGDAALMVPGAAALTGRHEELTMLVAIMAGRGDKVVDVTRQPVRLKALLPHSILRVIEGTGHMLHYEFPQQIADTIETLLDELDPYSRRGTKYPSAAPTPAVTG